MSQLCPGTGECQNTDELDMVPGFPGLYTRQDMHVRNRLMQVVDTNDNRESNSRKSHVARKK